MRTWAVLAVFCTVRAASALSQAAPLSAHDALVEALLGTHATAVVLDWQTGAAIAESGERVSGTPGSSIKPLMLAYALEHGIVRPETEVYCRRNLKVGARSLPCTHPADRNVFTAQSALAESCNMWFAAMGRRFTGPQLEATLAGARLPHDRMDGADNDRREMAVLGLRGVTATPMQLAAAYRSMLLRLPPDGVVVQGMLDSVNYGMAHPAVVAGMTILGKTGTASDVGERWTHGWFAGGVRGRWIVVVYVPHGDGGDAARLASRFFAAARQERQSK